MDFNVGDEPVLDRGVSHYHPSEDEIEDHRCQRSMYIGVHIPANRIDQPTRHHRRRHRKPKGSNDKKDQLSGIIEDESEKVTDPSHHVMFLLGEDDDGEEPHNLFCEMDELRLDDDGNETEWRETARWIKFEEDVEEGGERWSKPHVASLSLFSLFEVRNCLSSGVILLNVEATSMEQITEIILNKLVSEKKIIYDQRDKVKDVLQKRHHHLHDLKHKSNNKGSQIPLIRSLADIGKKYSARDVEKAQWTRRNSEIPTRSARMNANNSQPSLLKSNSSANVEKTKSDIEQLAVESSSQRFDLHFLKKIPLGAETSNILVGETDFLSQNVVVFIRLKEAALLGEMTEVPVPTRFLFVLLGPQGCASKNHEIGRSMATLMSDDVFHDVAYKARNCEDLLAGVDEFLSNCTVLPPAEWDPSIRIEPPKTKPISRKVPSMPNASQAMQSAGDGKGDNGISGGGGGQNGQPMKQNHTPEEDTHDDPALQRTGRLFGGLINDVKRRAPHYLSDFKDAFSIQCFGSFFFLYFACLTPIITFGGLLVQATGGYLGAIESILSGMIVGVTYALFSGQPLTILGSTGPMLVFESIVYQICTKLDWEYLPFRMWIGIWIAIFLFIIVAFDLSALVRYITRFTEESFAVLIAVIFIVEALKKLIHILDTSPVDLHWKVGEFKSLECNCSSRNGSVMVDFFKKNQKPTAVFKPPMLNNITYNNSIESLTVWANIDWEKISSYYFSLKHKKYLHICEKWGGFWMGSGCDNYYIPDVFFFSCILFICTFTISYGLKSMRTSRCFPNRVRSLISDFAVMIAITLMTLVDFLLGFHTPKLHVPDKFEPTLGYEVRGWLIPVLGRNPWWTIIVSIGPALLAVILIFMDQQITAVIVNRKENKLKKGSGYHLDLLIVAILILVNSILGIPWFVAATVLSINHVMSLKKESENVAPGEQPQFLGCREQRVTGVMIFLVIGLSVFLTPLLKRIPMAVLYGVFLFMGVASLNGVQLVQRLSLFFMPAKYQPDYIYLRYVPIGKVRLFTVIQLVLLALLWVIKTIKELSIGFPLMVLALCFARKGLEYIFSQHELKWLDDIMPERKKRQQDDKRKASGDGDAMLELLETKLEEAAVNNIIRSNESGINISEEMSKTGIWKSMVGGDKSAAGKTKKRSKRKSGSNNKDLETGGTEAIGHHGSTNNHAQPLLLKEADEDIEAITVNFMAPPEIVVDPPSNRASPELKEPRV